MAGAFSEERNVDEYTSPPTHCTIEKVIALALSIVHESDAAAPSRVLPGDCEADID